MTVRSITTELPEDLAVRVEALAARAGETPGQVVEEAVASWVEREEIRHHLTLEALADVDAGEVFSDEDIASWIDSLPDGEAPNGPRQ